MSDAWKQYTDNKFTFESFTKQGGYHLNKNYALGCIRCQKVMPISCDNCGGEGFEFGYNTQGILGVFCRQCNQGTVGWTCSSCGTQNPINYKTFYTTAGGCFVATAAFGNYNAPEVIYLSTFRDESLSRSVLGRGFIRTYYALSPRFAAIIAKSDLLRLLARKFFLRPVIFLLRFFRRN